MRECLTYCDRCRAPIEYAGSIVAIECVAGAIRLRLPSEPLDLCPSCGEGSWSG